MTIRTLEEISLEIRREHEKGTINQDKVDNFRQEIILAEALRYCKSDEEYKSVEMFGLECIMQYLCQAKNLIICVCDEFERFNFPSVILSQVCKDVNREKMLFLMNIGREEKNQRTSHATGECFLRHRLIIAYCLIKNNLKKEHDHD